MLTRISLVVAIVAGLAVGVLNFVKVKDKITVLVSERDNWHRQYTDTDAKLTSTTRELDRTTADLKRTRDDLATAQSEKERAQAELATVTRRANQLTEDLSKAKSDLANAQADLAAYVATGLTPPEILGLSREIKTTQANLVGAIEENKTLNKRIVSLDRELKKYRGIIEIIYLPATLKGKILVSDPKWDFVVLDVGEAHGVQKEGELLVSRDGKLVAKVVVRSVQKDRCIANVMPGWKLGDILEGDQVIPAHPQS
jgi:chromosome segregation ATPase